jgi:hypothetical protein
MAADRPTHPWPPTGARRDTVPPGGCWPVLKVPALLDWLKDSYYLHVVALAAYEKATGAFHAKKTAPIMEAVQIRLLFVDDNRSAIMVNISVVITLLNDDGFVVATPMITVSDDVTVAVPVTISVTLTNRYASTANTNPECLNAGIVPAWRPKELLPFRRGRRLRL